LTSSPPSALAAASAERVGIPSTAARPRSWRVSATDDLLRHSLGRRAGRIRPFYVDCRDQAGILAVRLVQLDLLRIGKAEAVDATLLLECWEVGSLRKEVLVGRVEVFQRLLQSVVGRFREPRRGCIAAPGAEVLAIDS
jgi:hypothetical protein